VGGASVVVVGLYHAGGWSGLTDKIAAMGAAYQHHFELILPTDTQTPFPWTGILFGLTLVMSNAYMIGNQAIVQRCLATKSVWHAKASMLCGAFFKMFIPGLVMVPGLIAVALYPGLEDGDHAFATLVKELLPPGLRGLLFAGFLAGLMSTIDSLLNSTATLWTKDIYERFLKKNAGSRHYMMVGQLATVTLLVFGVATSPLSKYYDGMYVAIQTFLSFFQGPVFSVILLGMFWPRATQWGGLAGLVGGISISVLLNIFKGSLFTIQDPFLYISWWTFLVGVVLNVTVSLATRPHPRARLAGLVLGLPKDAQGSCEAAVC
jgi:SSS family solute:Na+ symporter